MVLMISKNATSHVTAPIITKIKTTLPPDVSLTMFQSRRDSMISHYLKRFVLFSKVNAYAHFQEAIIKAFFNRLVCKVSYSLLNM